MNFPCYKRNNFPEKKILCLYFKRSSAGFSYPKVLVVIRQTYHSWMITGGNKRDLVLSEEKLFIQKVFFVAKKGRDYLVVVVFIFKIRTAVCYWLLQLKSIY